MTDMDELGITPEAPRTRAEDAPTEPGISPEIPDASPAEPMEPERVDEAPRGEPPKPSHAEVLKTRGNELDVARRHYWACTRLLEVSRKQAADALVAQARALEAMTKARNKLQQTAEAPADEEMEAELAAMAVPERP